MVAKGYRITAKLREEANYNIFRALREADAQPVVVKTFKSPHPSRQAISRLQWEYDLLLKTRHPNIIGALGVEPSENSLALILEGAEGISLADYRRGPRPELSSFFTIACSMVEAIAYLHRQHIIHKNICPENILVEPGSGQVKLLGLSFAAELAREAQYANANEAFEAGLTYSSPEQTGRMNRPLDHRTDLYSLGVVLYELLAGHPPFMADDPMEMIHAHIALAPRSLAEQRPELPPILWAIVMKLLAKSAEDRYQSALGLLHDLQVCQEQYTRAGTIDTFPIGARDVSDHFLIPDKLYGRSAELEELLYLYRRVAAGCSEVALIAGYSGVGKSRLVKELEQLLAARNVFFIQGKFEQFRQNTPLGSLLSAFSSLIRQLLSQTDAQIARWRDLLLQALGNAGQVIISVLPDLQLLLGPQPPVPELPPAEANNRFYQLFNRFVRVFARAEHPLCLFLDDLQWIDSTSLQWIETHLQDRDLEHFFLLGAYRANEVPPSHPLLLLIDRLERSKLPIRHIPLAPLDPPVIAQLLSDTLHQPAEDCADLAEIIYKKTNGNPFFLRQCLLSLYEKEAIVFSYDSLMWTYSTEQVRDIQISDNVIELMTELFYRLSDEVRHTIKYAACIGSQFDLQLLAEVVGHDSSAIYQQLAEAVHLGLIMPRYQDEQAYAKTFLFQHDRIQQTALSLLDDGEAKAIQLRIGRLLLARGGTDENEDQLFAAVAQLNAAIELIDDAAEKRQLLTLNLAASIRAQRATAYKPALEYITTAMRLLPEQEWEQPSSLTRDLLLQRAEAEHLRGHDAAAEGYYDRAVEHAATALDKARVYLRKIHYYNNLGKFSDAYRTGRKAIKPLGARLPRRFVPPRLLADIALYRLLRGRRSIADLLQLPEMQDEDCKMAILLMSTVARSAYQIRPELCIAVSVKMVNLCLRHGNTDGGFIGFLAFGPIFHGAILKNRRAGFEFGKLTLDLVEKYRSYAYRAETQFVVGYFAIPWQRPVAEMERHWQTAYEAGLESGDFFHAACAACGLIQSYWMRGLSYDDTMRAANRYLDFLRRVGNQEAILTLAAVRQSIRNLRGETVSTTSYDSDGFDEADYIERLAGFGSRHFAHYYYINKMYTLYLWGEYEQAEAVSRQSEAYLPDSPGMLHTAEHHYCQGLILAALLPQARGWQRWRWQRRLKNCVRRFERHTQDCAANFAPKWHLLRAEYARAKGSRAVAQEQYAAAIAAAARYGYLQVQALANARAADLYERSGQHRFAALCLNDAIYGYRKLGADAYAAFLSERHPELLAFGADQLRANSSMPGSGTSALTQNILSHYDLSTILKSSEAISREIRLPDLLAALTGIIIEHAGAQRLLLLLRQETGWVVQAERLAGQDEDVRMLAQLPLEQYTELAGSVVNYVLHTQEAVILDEATGNGDFANDDYIRRRQPRSILCAPLTKQGELTGIIYLENNLTAAAFTRERIDLLNLLSGQMAISIDNALLYDHLEEKVRDRTQELKQEKDKSDQLLLNILPAEIADELKRTGSTQAKQFEQVTVMFADFKDFSAISEQLSAQELVNEINYFYSQFDQIIHRHGVEKIKTIGDCYMCAGGIPAETADNARATLRAALEIRDFMLAEQANRAESGRPTFRIRIGLHTGPVVAGTVGIRKFAYDIWGDTVNIAARMESSGAPGKVNISDATYELIKAEFECTRRGKVEAKNKGMIEMYFVEQAKVAAHPAPVRRAVSQE